MPTAVLSITMDKSRNTNTFFARFYKSTKDIGGVPIDCYECHGLKVDNDTYEYLTDNRLAVDMIRRRKEGKK